MLEEIREGMAGNRKKGPDLVRQILRFLEIIAKIETVTLALGSDLAVSG